MGSPTIDMHTATTRLAVNPHLEGTTAMAMGDKIKHAAEEAVGKVKEGAGKVTGNEDLQAQGQADQAGANVKQAGEKAKDAAKDVFDK